MPEQPYLISVSVDYLVKQAQRSTYDDSSAMNELVRRFDGLAVYLAAAPKKVSPEIREDLANAARYALVKAVRRHDGRPGFPSFAKQYMAGAVSRELDRWLIPEVANLNADEGRSEVVDGADEYADVLRVMAPWGGGRLSEAVDSLHPTQLKLVEDRFIHDRAVKEIGSEGGTSGPAVSQRLNTVVSRLRAALAA